jgi:hypothetical protein
LIRRNVDGLLAEEPDEKAEDLAASMFALAIDERCRLAMATRARENIKGFGIEAVVDRWEELLARVAQTQQRRVPEMESAPG